MGQRLWARLIKEAPVRFISHLDLMGTFEKALRRAQIPVAFSQGFNPHPKISFAAALPVGVTSSGEYADLTLREEMSPGEVRDRINLQLPSGLALEEVRAVPLKVKSLMALVNLACYHLSLNYPREVAEGDLVGAWHRFLDQKEVIIERQTKKARKTFDILPFLCRQELELASEGKASLLLWLAIGPQGSVRPEEILAAFWNFSGWEGMVTHVHRRGLYIARGEKCYTPLDVPLDE